MLFLKIVDMSEHSGRIYNLKNGNWPLASQAHRFNGPFDVRISRIVNPSIHQSMI